MIYRPSALCLSGPVNSTAAGNRPVALLLTSTVERRALFCEIYGTNPKPTNW